MFTLCGFIQPVALRAGKVCVWEDRSKSGPRRTCSYRVMALTEAHRAEEQNIQVRNARGERLAALLRTPMGAPVGRCMVIAHGFRDSKHGRLVATLSEAMDWTQTIRFDMSGNGESEGSFRFSNYADECEDLRAVVLHARLALKLTVDCVVGHSKAGGAVFLYAAKYADVPLVVNVAGRFDMARGVFALSQTAYTDIELVARFLHLSGR
jgi:pimeloyl-ACP methyl ester carboxylesterase